MNIDKEIIPRKKQQHNIIHLYKKSHLYKKASPEPINPKPPDT